MAEAWDLENCFFKCKTFSSPKQQQQLQIAGDGCDGGESPSSCFLFQKINNEKIFLSSKVLPFASNHYWKCHREKWAALGASLSRIWLNNENLIHRLHVNLMEICRQSFESCANRVTWCWSFTRCVEKLVRLFKTRHWELLPKEISEIRIKQAFKGLICFDVLSKQSHPKVIEARQFSSCKHMTSTSFSKVNSATAFGTLYRPPLIA